MRAHFKLTPKGIIESLNLRRPIYCKTAAYGHFGRNDPDFTWESTDKAAKLASDAGLREPVSGSEVAKSSVDPTRVSQGYASNEAALRLHG